MPSQPASATFPGVNGPLLTPGGTVDTAGKTVTDFDFSFYPTRGVFSADGASIAYSKFISDTREALRVRTSAGQDTEILQLPTGFDVSSISWSPDSTRLAVGVRNEDFTSSILLVTIADASSTYLVQGTGNWDSESAAWQPHGNLVAFTRGNDLFTVDATTKAVTQRTFECTYDLTPGGAADCGNDPQERTISYPAWHPDGTKLAMDVYDYNRDTGATDAYVGSLTLGSSTVNKLFDIPQSGDNSHGFSEPRYSPDGTKLTLQHNVNLNDPNQYIKNLSTGALTSMNDDFWISDWQACPAPDPCPSFATDKQTPTLKITVLKNAGLSVLAALSPAHPGVPLTITLARRTTTGWRNVKTVSVAQNRQGFAVAAFTRPDASRCRFASSFAGDSDHLPVTQTKAFAC